MKYFIFFVLFICCNGVFADFGFDYFYMEGRVFGVDEQPLRNEVIYFRDSAGEISRVKTDGNGVYRVKSNYILPCLSGVSGKEDKRKRAFGSNFSTISVYHKSNCAELPQQWSQFYFDYEKRRDKEQKALQNIHFTNDCELIENERIEDAHQLYLDRKQQMIRFCQDVDNPKFGNNMYRYMRTYFEPLGLNDEDFLEGFGFSNQCDVVDLISEDKIEISFLTDWYGSGFKKTSYIYFKKNGIIVEENIKYEYPSSE